MSLPLTSESPKHNKHLAHHFDSMEQQHNSAKLGMWVFLTTEILLFSGLFLAYLFFRWMSPEVFHHASDMLSWKMGALNTFVLITSSLTMALAVRCAQLNQQKWLVINLALTLALAGCFLVVKFFEYEAKISHGVLPGRWFDPHGAEALILQYPYARQFFSVYYLMTGLHGIHVVGGMAVIAWMLWMAVKRRFSAEYHTPVEVTGLYWHLVDLIWIFLFPILYLVDRS